MSARWRLVTALVMAALLLPLACFIASPEPAPVEADRASISKVSTGPTPPSAAPSPSLAVSVRPSVRAARTRGERVRAATPHTHAPRQVRHDGLRWDLLARCESTNNPRANTGNGYYGAYQFDLRTWRSVGGSGYPHHASLTEQTHRAQRLYAQRGRSPWPTCGRYL